MAKTFKFVLIDQMTMEYLSNESNICFTGCETSGHLGAAFWHSVDQIEASLYHCVLRLPSAGLPILYNT